MRAQGVAVIALRLPACAQRDHRHTLRPSSIAGANIAGAEAGYGRPERMRVSEG